MISLELLEELVAFEQYGTLSATAEHLMITQPSVTRGMKRLEEQLGVDLFNRQTNKITLNKTGKIAAKKAKDLLKAEHDFKESVINYAQNQNSIRIGSTTPGPLIICENNQHFYQEKISISQKIINNNDIIRDLQNHKEQIIFSNQEIFSNDIESLYIGIEHLCVKIDPFNPLAAKKSLTFKDLAEETFLTVNNIGPWKKIIEKNIPDAKFLYQENRDALTELKKHSNFPYFVSNLTKFIYSKQEDNDNRFLVPIIDENNKLEIFANYLISQRSKVLPLLKELIKVWID
ncbi:LysR family transcriptional regulator [Lactobacillus kitasatonis]|uniref:LysR family transcriptional regulator n=1 Tax=Lactobacillus kitasatonis TaxID=237446 RepID=UPI0026E9BFBE|nr:LysR family transcriptional regulator [Lactobacillus kitasatonis]